jgi:hypothetical protein
MRPEAGDGAARELRVQALQHGAPVRDHVLRAPDVSHPVVQQRLPLHAPGADPLCRQPNDADAAALPLRRWGRGARQRERQIWLRAAARLGGPREPQWHGGAVRPCPPPLWPPAAGAARHLPLLAGRRRQPPGVPQDRETHLRPLHLCRAGPPRAVRPPGRDRGPLRWMPRTG